LKKSTGAAGYPAPGLQILPGFQWALVSDSAKRRPVRQPGRLLRRARELPGEPRSVSTTESPYRYIKLRGAFR